MQPHPQPQAARDSFTGWEKYPERDEASDRDSLIDSSVLLSRQLSQLSGRLFSKEIDVGLIRLQASDTGK